jgi:hypothetical protein
MNELLDPEVLTDEITSTSDRIECEGICHNGPFDDSPKALRYAADHDPEAPAAFLLIFPCCDAQMALCAKKVDALFERTLTSRSGAVKCKYCQMVVPMETVTVIPLNQA